MENLGLTWSVEKEVATHSSILAWRIPGTEEPGGLQSMGSQRVRYDWVTSLTWSNWDLERQLGWCGVWVGGGGLAEAVVKTTLEVAAFKGEKWWRLNWGSPSGEGWGGMEREWLSWYNQGDTLCGELETERPRVRKLDQLWLWDLGGVRWFPFCFWSYGVRW